MHPNHKQAKDSRSTKLKSMTKGYADGGLVEGAHKNEQYDEMRRKFWRTTQSQELATGKNTSDETGNPFHGEGGLGKELENKASKFRKQNRGGRS